MQLIQKLDCPVFLVINKIDLVLRSKLLPLIERFSALHPFAEVIPISASKKDGLDTLLTKLVEYLPEGQRYFPKEQFTDQPERFLVAELIRERILLETGEEVPYASAVVVERFEEPEPVVARARRRCSQITPDAHFGRDLLRAFGAKGNLDRQRREQTQEHRCGGPQGDRVAAGHQGLS